MTILVVGASGATGRLLVEKLLNRGQNVKAIARSSDKLPKILTSNDQLTVIGASILELSDLEMAQLVKGCDAVASCLGHNLNLKGIYGHPRRLVTDAIRRLCNAIKTNKSGKPTKFVLMNTTGNTNRNLLEPISLAQRLVMGLIRLLLPPQVDNEQAADFFAHKNWTKRPGD
jgi:nucleoside-diphosphate-sugar epimerase